MTTQRPLDLPPVDIDLGKFVVFTPAVRTNCRYRVCAGGRRFGQTGLHIGTIGLLSGCGYEILIRFDDSIVEAFSPVSVFPEI